MPMALFNYIKFKFLLYDITDLELIFNDPMNSKL